MRTLRRISALALTALASLAFASSFRAAPNYPPRVTILRTPNGGIQPQTVLDRDGVLHMIYFAGNAAGGDIEYVKRDSESGSFSAPIRVNSIPHSAIAIGTVRGPQMAVGRDGIAQVIWFGPAEKNTAGEVAMPVFFARMNGGRTAFEPQRNLVKYATGGDGGISVAADDKGNVYAVWHATGAQPGEDHRRVYLARSTDNGKTFAREVPVSPGELGACGCCGMRAFVDARGTLYVLYRDAAQLIHRDMTLLVSADKGTTFQSKTLSAWELNACAMTTASLANTRAGVAAAWEKAGEVYFTSIDERTLSAADSIAARGEGHNRKHPAVAVDASGNTLLAWTEGTGWAKGGSLAWQLFDAAGKPLASGSAPDLPVWGLPSVVSERSGSLTVFY